MAIEAKFNRSMSILARPISIDLGQTPVLCWKWYIDSAVKGADMTRLGRSDFAARLYVGFDMPDSALSAGAAFKLRIARALYDRRIPDAAVLYVWDNSRPVGTRIKSPYSDRIELVVANVGNTQAKTWVTERFDVARDFQQAFKDQPGKPTVVAVASDGDDTKSSGTSGFTDIHFVRRDESCSP